MLNLAVAVLDAPVSSTGGAADFAMEMQCPHVFWDLSRRGLCFKIWFFVDQIMVYMADVQTFYVWTFPSPAHMHMPFCLSEMSE